MMNQAVYSSTAESSRILDMLCSLIDIPDNIRRHVQNVSFTGKRNFPYFPIPFKETEVAAALKAVEACVACALLDRKEARSSRAIEVNLEKTTAFLFQTYLATVDGFGKLDQGVKRYLKDTDLLQAQSNPYRRMSANLYKTCHSGEYYHIHGSLEASTTLKMIGLDPHRPDLITHDAIVNTIESHVMRYSVAELEDLNASNKQAGVPALTHDDFLRTTHGEANLNSPPWCLENLETETSPSPLPDVSRSRILAGIKVIELCRIIAGPVIGRTLAEYGADVLKITSPQLSDVPFFQVDGNMGKHAANIDLKSESGRKVFEELLADVDVILDGYRPGAIERLGYGLDTLTKLAKQRNKGIVYVNENCFGYTGDWRHRPGWQQIADCVSGVAWAQGHFMNLAEPVVPPFPISDYGTGCMGAIAALTGLLNRATTGGSWHGKVSLLQYDLLLFKVGMYPEDVQKVLRNEAGDEFLALRHSNSVDQISGTVLRRFKTQFPDLFDQQQILEAWRSHAYGANVMTVRPVVQVEGLDNSFQRSSRPNGSDDASWDFGLEKDYRLSSKS